MRATQVWDCICESALRFYRFIIKLAINAHQVIAYWRSRINQDRCGNNERNPASHNRPAAAARRSATTRSERDKVNKTPNVQSTRVLESHLINSGTVIKTPNSRKQKICSFFRRLSLNNLMEYCVIALNEASSSGCSNKFDLSTSDKPVWLLGEQYDLPQDAEKLMNDVQSKLWITYRKNFPPIDEGSRYTTDRGFGCMIRCGQMVLANAFLYKNLGREWRWNPEAIENNPDVYMKILRLFQDKEECLYSIHNITRSGQHEGKTVGEWFGPNTIAQALKRIATDALSPTGGSELLISIEAALDNVVVIDEIKSKFKSTRQPTKKTPDESENDQQVCQSTAAVKATNENQSIDKNVTTGIELKLSTIEKKEWLPGLLFIQLRLGLSKINPLYFNALKKTFQLKNSLGIIGGRPNHALYLIGYTGDDIIYLDPHITQQYVDFDSNQLEVVDEESPSKRLPADSTYHCSSPEKMALDKLDPSLALCFYFHEESEFDDWCKASEELLIKSEVTPMFEITTSRPPGWNVSMTSTLIDTASNGWDLLQMD